MHFFKEQRWASSLSSSSVLPTPHLASAHPPRLVLHQTALLASASAGTRIIALPKRKVAGTSSGFGGSIFGVVSFSFLLGMGFVLIFSKYSNQKDSSLG